MLVDVPKLLGVLGIEYKAIRSELWACCPLPLHPEGKASWSIVNDPTSPKNGYHKCFGCHRKGGPINLVSTILHVTEFSARQWLLDNGCVIDQQTPDTLPGRVRCRVEDPTTEHRLALPEGVVVGKPFREWPGVIRHYLAERGITAWQVGAHGLGYSVAGEQSCRLFIPIRSQYGSLLFYTGRSFSGARLRYRSAADQVGARPKEALFGESLWRTRSPLVVYVAEGAIKVLAIERALCGIGTGETGPAIAAFSGSEIHDEQVLKLSRFERIVYVADNNETGLRFAAEVEGKLSARDIRVVVPSEDSDLLPREELAALLSQEVL